MPKSKAQKRREALERMAKFCGGKEDRPHVLAQRERLRTLVGKDSGLTGLALAVFRESGERWNA